MIKVDIFSGFLGAGKTTPIKKLLAEAYKGEKVVLIENEFGDIAIDGGFLQQTGVTINEMNSGCICCTLKGDFTRALQEVAERFSPQRILIEPSGVGKLSDVIDAVRACGDFVTVNAAVAVADAKKCRMYLKNFGEFFSDQIKSAGAVILSRTGDIGEDKLAQALAVIRQLNPDATVITTPWEQLPGGEILAAAEQKATLTMELAALVLEQQGTEHHHHHEHDHHGQEHEHHHDHGPEHEHHHDHGPEHEHHHDHGSECSCGCGHDHHHDHGPAHEHHHDHGPECSCGHDHHHHHHADEVFSTFGAETGKKFSEQQLRAALEAFEDSAECGTVLRAKGYLDCQDGGGWLWFDYVPGEIDIRRGSPR